MQNVLVMVKIEEVSTALKLAYYSKVRILLE